MCCTLPWDGEWKVCVRCPCERQWPPRGDTISIVLSEGVYYACHPECVEYIPEIDYRWT